MKSRPKRILIADDHPMVRKGIRANIDMEPGLEVIDEAFDGRMAVDLACLLEPDLVLMDIRMPNQDGISATHELREKKPRIPVLMLSAHDTLEYVLEALRAGAAGYVLKEASIEHLSSSIHRVIAGEDAVDPELAQRLLKRIANEQYNGFPNPLEQDSLPEFHSPDERAAIVASLTNSELAVLDLIIKGKTNPQISRELYLSRDTIKNYVQRIIRKLDVSDRTQAAVKAVRLGLAEAA